MLLLTLPILSTFLIAAEQVEIPPGSIYYYQDHEGRKQVGQFVPSEFIKYGYTIRDRFGYEVLVVDREMTAEEILQKEAEAQQAKAALEQKRADEILLKNYSSTEDLNRVYNNRKESIDIIIEITRGNIIQMQSELQDQQDIAVKAERSGRDVPAHIVTRIDEIDEQISELLSFVEQKEGEKDVLSEQQEKELERLKLLLGEE